MARLCDQTVDSPKPMRILIKKPKALRLQDHPISSNVGRSASGKTTPPKLPPRIAMPVASPSFLSNQWPRTLAATVLRIAHPAPSTIPYVTMNCQKCELSAMPKMPARQRALPTTSSILEPCLSKTRPI